MLGVGVGFDTKVADKIKIQKPIGEFNYIIPDSREGWVESVRLLIEAYFIGSALPTFNYSIIRDYGTPIRTFGGKSAGPRPLKKLHKQIAHIFNKHIGNPITITQIVDIMNMIGVCVVSGNARRSAQIVFGDPNNEEYVKLKDYKWDAEKETYTGTNVQRTEYGWLSNNSVYSTLGDDYRTIAKSTGQNGEPGYLWLENARAYGRFKDPKNYKDIRAVGANPCNEQTLESYEMCCLVETFPARCKDIEDFKRTLKFAYLYAKTVTLGTTHWVETNRVQLRNRRIGASLSGIVQFVGEHGLDAFKTWLNEGYNTIQNYDTIYSDWFAVPRSIKTTSIKPSGSISLLPGATPGLHYPESRYYIRRIIIAKNSELVPFIEKAGYRMEDYTDEPETSWSVEIPVDVGGVRTLSEVSMWEQLEMAAFIQEHWSDNQVSCTVTFKEHEKNDIANALNFYQYRLKGISFLPKLEKGAYAQMPYEEITEDRYKELTKNIKNLKFKNISEDAVVEKFCDTETCLI
jgi:adenosylcobalamin-dependent ribonucleoside-triphosphate reductase